MTFHTQQSLSGFIASEPQQSATENGETRFHVRVGQAHFLREESGSFTVLEPTFTTSSPTVPPPIGRSRGSLRATALSLRAT